MAQGRGKEPGGAASSEGVSLDALFDAPSVGGPGGDGGSDADWSAWGNLWQVPAIVVSTLLIAIGVYVATQRVPENDFDGVLEEAEALIAVGEFDEARTRLKDMLEPNLAEATSIQQARYHAAMADWVSASQQIRGVSAFANNRTIVDQYERAIDHGLVLSAPRLERWANALIDLGEVAAAKDRLTELEALGVTDAGGPDARQRRNRLLRRLVKTSLRQEELSFDAMMEILSDYRRDPLLTVSDRAWIAAHRARLRLEAGLAHEAVDHLLLDMRRLEEEDVQPEASSWAELYALLGRGYYDVGAYEHAVFHLEAALERAGTADTARSLALLVLARINMARGDYDSAYERFDTVVRDFVDTEERLPGLVGRAEVASILGDHEQSLEDFRAACALLEDAPPRRDVTAESISGALADRHDAALTTGNLDLALAYVSLAESLFDTANVPPPVLHRMASTSRQIADNIMHDASRGPDGVPLPMIQIDPAVRHAALEKYERAGEYFLRHARSLSAMPGADEVWASSLWLAGDSYDLAGRPRVAIRTFLEYVAGRPVDDPRRAEVTNRLGQAYQAEGEFESAVDAFQRVIDEHPRSPFGTASHVPLARCLMALERFPEAEDQLVKIVDGRESAQNPILPAAADYREALVELGRIYYVTEQYPDAIERLTAAVDRYPDDDRIEETRFRLADSHHRLARALRQELADAPKMLPHDRLLRQSLVQEHLAAALGLYDQVVDGFARRDRRQLTRLQRDFERYAVIARGDCAFELGRFELAARLFDQAARQYSDHHVSMHALVQIVNCFEQLGLKRDADIAHQNALVRLRQLSDEVFQDPEALMDRDAWERWLLNRPVGLARAPSSAVSN